MSSLMTESSSSRGRRSLLKWSPSILSSSPITDPRHPRSGGGSAIGSATGARRPRRLGGPSGRGLVVARRGGLQTPTSAGPPPPGRRGPRPPPSGEGDGGKQGKKEREGNRMMVVDTRGSGDVRTVPWTSRESLLMRLARDTRDPDLRRRCRVVMSLEPYRSQNTIFTPEGKRTYLQLKERVLRAVGKSLEEEKDSNLTLPVLDQESVNRILELQGDVQVEDVIGDKTANKVFKAMDEKLRAIEPAKNACETGSILKSPSPTKIRGEEAQPGLRRVSFLESDDEGAAPPQMTISDAYNVALEKWKTKHQKRLSRKSNEWKYPPLTPSPSSSVRPVSRSKKTMSRSSPSSRSSLREPPEMTIAFLYEGEVKDTSSEEEDRERRRKSWKEE